MDIKNLIALPGEVHLPIANMRRMYRTEEVEGRLSRLEEDSHHDLRATYRRMIDRGGQRFQVKPSGTVDMKHLYQELLNFTEPLDEIKRSIALCQDSKDGLKIEPILLLGPAGIGKTHFSQQIAKLIGTGANLVPMSSMTAGWLLSGSSSQWKGAKPGKVFETIVSGEYANPVITIDEIDKASCDAQYDPLGALYQLLEHDTAQNFVDEFAEVPIDASQVIWVTTANDERQIPGPILNRMSVYEIKTPTFEHARNIALTLYISFRSTHDWGKFFDENPGDDVLDCLAKVGPREMRRALLAGFGNAKLEGVSCVKPEHIPDSKNKKTSIGF